MAVRRGGVVLRITGNGGLGERAKRKEGVKESER